MEKKELSIRIPRWVVKNLRRSLPLTAVFCLAVYFLSVRVDQKWDVYNDNRYMFSFNYVNRVSVDAPAFLGNSRTFDPNKEKILGVFRYTNMERNYSGVSSWMNEKAKREMPLYVKAAIKFDTLLSWKGLRFFVIMLALAFGGFWFYDNYRLSISVAPEKPDDNANVGQK